MLACKFCIYLEEEELTDNDTSTRLRYEDLQGKRPQRRYMLCTTSSSRGFRHPDVYGIRALDAASDDSNHVRLGYRVVFPLFVARIRLLSPNPI